MYEMILSQTYSPIQSFRIWRAESCSARPHRVARTLYSRAAAGASWIQPEWKSYAHLGRFAMVRKSQKVVILIKESTLILRVSSLHFEPPIRSDMGVALDGGRVRRNTIQHLHRFSGIL